MRGFGRLDGDEGFAEVFFEDAFVSDDFVLGEVNSGWGLQWRPQDPSAV